MRLARRHAAVLAALLVVALALPALAQGVPGQTPGPGGQMPGPGLYGPDGSRGPYGPHAFGPRHPGPFVWAAGLFFLLRLLFLVGLILVVWRLLGARTFWQRPDPATQVLRERYARGELSEDEYRKRLATLS